MPVATEVPSTTIVAAAVVVAVARGPRPVAVGVARSLARGPRPAACRPTPAARASEVWDLPVVGRLAGASHEVKWGADRVLGVVPAVAFKILEEQVLD